MTVAVYPGTFDPPTLGHLDIIARGSKLFDRLVVAVGPNPAKTTLFSTRERIALLREIARPHANVTVEAFEGLAVDFVKARGARAILRGIRTFSDFEYEFAMALTNRSFAREVETIFVMASVEYSFISSRLIKEAASLGGDVAAFVPPVVARALAGKFRKAARPTRRGGK